MFRLSTQRDHGGEIETVRDFDDLTEAVDVAKEFALSVAERDFAAVRVTTAGVKDESLDAVTVLELATD